MQQKFTLSCFADLPLKEGFSLDELVIETRRMFDEEGMAGLVNVIVLLLDMIVHPPLLGKWEKAESNCCGHAHYVVHSQESKSMRSSAGQLNLLWTRIRCAGCGKSFIPLRGYLNLEPHQRKTSELEKIVAEVVSEQSYRRSSQHLETIGSIPVPHTTLHRWVMKSDCDEISLKKRVKTLVADGTGFKQKLDADGSNRGQVCAVVGITKDNVVVPYGAWTEESWADISREIKKANHPSPDKIKFNPIADLLVSDGEVPLVKYMGRLTKETQRCIWHLPHDLHPLLRYSDDAPPEEARTFTSELAGIIDIELPKEDVEKVGLEDRLNLEKTVFEAEKGVQNLVNELKSRGYNAAATYLANAKAKMFSYVRLWLKTGVVHPRVSSMIERMMREIGRRIKKIGHGWSPEGAAKMTRIIIKRITSADEWNKHWQEKLKITGKVKLSFRGCELA